MEKNDFWHEYFSSNNLFHHLKILPKLKSCECPFRSWQAASTAGLSHDWPQCPKIQIPTEGKAVLFQAVRCTHEWNAQRDLLDDDSGEINGLRMGRPPPASRTTGHRYPLKMPGCRGTSWPNPGPQGPAQRRVEGICATKAQNKTRGILLTFLHVFKNPSLDPST